MYHAEDGAKKYLVLKTRPLGYAGNGQLGRRNSIKTKCAGRNKLVPIRRWLIGPSKGSVVSWKADGPDKIV